MTAENEVDAPLILVLGPNSVLVGRGGGNIPTYYSQVVPQLESALLGRLGVPQSGSSSSGDAGAHINNEGSMHVVGSGGASHQEGHMMGHGSGNSTRGNNSGTHTSSNRWEWPPHVVRLAEDELLIVVFPTDWSRELRVALARVVFEDLKAASAVFVCSAVAAAYAVGMGLAGNDAHAALYGDLEDQRRRQKNRKDRLLGGVRGSKNSDDDDDVGSDSDEDEDEDESENDEDNERSSNESSSSDDDDEENDKANARRKTNPKKGKGSSSAAASSSDKKSAEATSKTKRGRTNAAEDDDEAAEEEEKALVRNGASASAGKDLPQVGARRQSATTTETYPTVAGGLPVKTPRKSTRLCIIELHYDRLTCSHVYNGAVSRFVSHPRLPAAAADRHGTLLSARDASNAAVLAEKERISGGNSNATSSTSPSLSFDAVLSLCSPSAGGIIPTTLAKLERKVAADVADEEERSTAPSALFIDFQVAMVFTGEAATIKGVRESINEHFPCRSADPYDDALGHRVLLPPIAPTTVPFIQNYGGSEGQPHPTFVADLTPFLGASVLSTVPDKVIEKIAVTRALYEQKGADVILSRSAI